VLTSAEYLAGALLLAFELGCAAVAATLIVRRRRAADLDGVPRVIAWALIAVAFVFAAHLIPGVLGVLEPAAVISTSLLLLGVAFVVPDRLVRPAVPGPPPAQREPRYALWLGVGAVVACAVYLIGWALDHGGQALSQSDVVSFHLPNVARWIQDGSLWGIHDWIPNRAPGNYPETGDVFMLAAILPWDSEIIVRFVGYPFVALAGLSVFAAGRELAVPRGTAALAAAAVIAMPAVSYIAISGLADPEMIGTFGAGAYFLLRHWRTRDGFDLALAGLGLGLAFGSRWYAVPAVLAVLGAWAVAAWIERARRRGGLGEAGILAGIVAVVGGFWLLRNWIESGNPLFPVKVAPLGIDVFDAPRDVYREKFGFTLAHYLTDTDVLGKYIWPKFLDFLSFTAIALSVSVVIGAVAGWRRRSGAGRGIGGRVLAMSAVAIAIAIVYLGTPYTASGPEGIPFEAFVNSRYVVPGLVVAAPVLAWLISSAGALGPWLQGLLALAVLDALRRNIDLPGGGVGPGWLLLAAVVLGLGLLGYLVIRDSAADLRPGRPRLVAGAICVAVLGIGAIAVGAVQKNRFEDDRYTTDGPAIDYVNDEYPAQLRIGIVGDGFASYPLFGPRLDNRVDYVGHRVDEMLKPFNRRPAFDRALRRGGYDAIAWTSLDTLHENLPLEQAKWLEQDGYRRVAEGNDPLLNSEVALYLPPKVELPKLNEPF
jgi:hypothetical protein